MATKKRGSLNPHGAPVLRRETLTNSVAAVEMDSVKMASGFVALGTAGALVFGHVMSFSKNMGTPVESDGTAGAAFGSFTGAFTAASDNQTVAKVKAEVDISKFSLYTMTPDDTLGTTTGSNLAGYFMDLKDEDELDESTAAATAAQYFSWGVDPLASANTIVNIYESQVFGV